ncbi:GspH/FimT family pseudopilin [Magnetospira sp. QH-2]|uniref:GspH/FimT family pseudopilin n=1 Tax=Magnetospira sp. (strain QH-2) TaxID=1288970 RepID=UPI00130DFF59|nr:GspH/FimT family pseudopilin [Magnetospira sp. QH-2]
MPTDSGFTLLEMLVVLALTALVAGLAGPAMVSRGTDRSPDQVAASLAATLRLARSEALRGGQTMDVVFNPSDKNWALENGRNKGVLPDSQTFRLIVPEEWNRIRFHPDGSSSGGEIKIFSARDRAVIQVDWLTGRVRLQDQPAASGEFDSVGSPRPEATPPPRG